MLTGAARLAQEAQEKAGSVARQQEVERRRRELERKREALEARIDALRLEFEAEEEETERIIDAGGGAGGAALEDRQDMARVREVDRTPIGRPGPGR